MLDQNGVWWAALGEQCTELPDERLHFVNQCIKLETKDRMPQTVNDRSLSRHLTRSFPEDEGVKCQHELVIL